MTCRGCSDPKCPDIVKCLQCKEPLNRGEQLTFLDNGNPGLGGCHLRCVAAYHASKSNACEICGASTELRCSDCAIDGKGRIPLCGRTACEAAHVRARNCRPSTPFALYEAKP